MDSVAFEELLVSCLEQPSKKNLDNLLAALRTAGLMAQEAGDP